MCAETASILGDIIIMMAGYYQCVTISVNVSSAVYDINIMYLSLPSACNIIIQNIWLRYGAVGFMIAVAGQLDSVDVECYVLPKIHPFLRLPVIQIQEVCILLSVLRDPVPRGVFDYLLKQQNIREIFEW